MSQRGKPKKIFGLVDEQFSLWICLIFFSTYVAADNILELISVRSGHPAAIAFVVTVATLFLHLIAKYLSFRKSGIRSRKRSQRPANSIERELVTHQNERIYRELSHASGDIFIYRNAEGQIIDCNKTAKTYFGDKIKEALPTLLAETELKEGSRPETQDIQLDTLLGRCWFAWTDLVIHDPQTGECTIGSVARDITKHKKAEQALKENTDKVKAANNAKFHFLAMVSHEIRTPLNGVIGMAQLLRDSELQPAQHSYVEAIMTSGHSLNHLVDDLLDTAQIESGHSDLCPRPTNITTLVEDVAEILSSRARDNGLALATFVDPQIPQSVDVDSGRLRQVLLNLAGNAAKFTQAGGVAIHVRLVGKVETGVNAVDVQFCIADSGPGIAKEGQRNIFNEFVQLDDGATRSHGGAGLGLAISQNLIKLMGGTIRLQSEMDKGSRFLFNLNLPFKTDVKVMAEPSSRVVSIILPRTPARQAIAETARFLGFSVETFDDLSQFARLSNGQHSDHSVIVAHEDLDVSIDTLHQLRGKLGNDAQLLLLGDAVQRQQVDPLLKEGFDGWLTWPVRSQTLSNVLNQTTHQPGTPSRHSPALQPSGKRLNVLLAEDNQINALLAKALFSNMGHLVTHALNGQDAVDKVTSGEVFDIIFMDLHMPVMDGTTAIREIRKYEAQSGNPPWPIIVVSADGQDDASRAALSAGADEYLTKPLNVDDLATLLDSKTPRHGAEKV